MTLTEYGIQNENSDVRAHVSVVNKTIYVFRTQAGRDAIKKHQPQERTATQPGAVGATASGWPMPWELIDGIRAVRFSEWYSWRLFCPELPTSLKGDLAVQCVLAAMRNGDFPFWVDVEESDDPTIQVQGTDVLIQHGCKVQVKCDYKSGERPFGTGNLFLQRAERNPFKCH